MLQQTFNYPNLHKVTIRSWIRRTWNQISHYIKCLQELIHFVIPFPLIIWWTMNIIFVTDSQTSKDTSISNCTLKHKIGRIPSSSNIHSQPYFGINSPHLNNTFFKCNFSCLRSSHILDTLFNLMQSIRSHP